MPDFSPARLHKLLTHPNSVLRHDVDYDPNCALRMAQLESELGLRSVYYVRPLDCYQNNRPQTFQKIYLYGHELGVHADLMEPRNAQISDDQLVDVAEGTFEALCEDLPMVRRISFHAPPRDVFWRDIEGFDHAVKPEWFGRYIADSRGVFRFQPEQALTWGEPIQLNLHPEWWFWDRETADRWRKAEATKP
jgi:hypothetical protein